MEVIFKWLILGLIVAGVAAAVRHLWQVDRARRAAAAKAKLEREDGYRRWLEAKAAVRTRKQSAASNAQVSRNAMSAPSVPPCDPGDSWAQPCNFGGAPAFEGGGGTFDGGGASGDWGGSSSSDSCSSSDSGSCGSSD